MAEAIEDVKRNALASAAAEESRRLVQVWSTQDAERSWYLVQTGQRWAKRSRQKMVAMRFDTYVPMTIRMQKVGRKHMSQTQRANGAEVLRPAPSPVFPNYVFVRFDPRTEAWHDLFRFAGVYGLACKDDQPVAVPDGLIEEWKLKAQCGIISPKTLLPDFFTWREGETGRVVDGPFAGNNVVLLQDRTLDQVDESEPLRCLLELFGRKVRVSIGPDQLVKD